jgi:hypothetical protein
MKRTLIAICALMLSACAFDDAFVRKEVVTETVYVVRKATDQQKALPPMPTSIDVTKASQTDLAQWLADSERRMLDLEAIIRNLVDFYEKPVEGDKSNNKATPPSPPASAASGP